MSADNTEKRKDNKDECVLEDELSDKDPGSRCYIINTSGCCLDPCMQPIEEYLCCC